MAGWPDRLLALVAALGGCGEPEVPESASGRTRCADSVLTWDTFGDPFMRSWCTGCHSSQLGVQARSEAPIGVDFDTLEGVQTNLTRIRTRAVDQRTMPPGGGPDDAALALLDEWLRCDAPGTTPDVTTEPEPEPIDTGTPPTSPGCNRIGDWEVTGVSCDGGDFSSEWFAQYPTTAFEIRDEIDTCAIFYIRADDQCEEVQLWRSTLTPPVAPIEFVSIFDCDPNGCAFAGAVLGTCSVGPLGVYTDLPVGNLGIDQMRLGPFPGPPGVPCGTLSFDVVRMD